VNRSMPLPFSGRWTRVGAAFALLLLCEASSAMAQNIPSVETPVAPNVPLIPAPAPAVATDATQTSASQLHLSGPESDAFRARLDYSDGSFYLRSSDDNLVFVPGGRMHIDTYGFAGPGVSDYHRSNGTGLKVNLFFRRFVVEIGGLVRKKFFYWIGANMGQTSLDASQNSTSTANVYDGFIGYMPVPNIRIYAGQYNAPYTMENVTSSRWLDLMERSLSVRAIATPYNKADGLMVWADTENQMVEGQIGVFGGDGQNRPNIDNNVDGMGRILVRPFITSRSDAFKRAHIGVGGRFGWRDHDFVRYDAPSLSTPGGYTFWSSSYSVTGSDGSSTTMHIQPYRAQGSISGELYLPFERFDVRGELVYVNEGRREVTDSDKASTVRAGVFRGVSGYAQISWWPWGTPRVNGNPAGYYGVLKVPEGLGKQAPYGVQLVGRLEAVRLHYNSNSRAGDNGKYDQTSDAISVNVAQAAINYWATKHIRLTAEYSLYHFPGDGKSTKNQAVAPGVAAKVDPSADILHEISVRFGLAL